MGKENQIQLKCSGCGAPISFADKACPYCGKTNKNATEHIKTREKVEKQTNEIGDMLPPLKSVILKWGLPTQWLF